MGLSGPKAPIEPPDHPPGDLDGVALSVVGGDELVDEALGVDPAERVIAEAELAGVVGDDDRARPSGPSASMAPHSAASLVAAHRVGRRLRRVGEAERAQVLRPLLVRSQSRAA